MAEVSAEDIERLASRLALVVSEDGEAENAGRAMGQLARRLGMTGGQLKAMFLAGAAGAEPPGEARELAGLRRGLAESDAKLRQAEQDREALLREVAGLRQTLRQSRAAGRSRNGLAAVVVVVVIGAAAISALIPLSTLQAMVGIALPLPPPAGPVGDPLADISRTAVVHAARALVFLRPDRTAPVLATLPAGMPVVVRRLVWNMLMQWAEVEVGSSVGYVLTSDIDLS